MNIKLNNLEVVTSVNVISKMLDMEENLITKVRWNIGKNLNILQRIYEEINKSEIDLLKKYALKDEELNVKVYDEDDPLGSYKKGEPILLPNKKLEFIQKRNELLLCDNDIELLSVNINDMPVKLTKGVSLNGIEYMFNESIE